MATSSLADAGGIFGAGADEDDEYHQLQMSMHHNQLQHQHPPAENSSMMATSTAPSTQKKKRTHPDPDAEVIALSPKTLMTTNRFICEVCKKGFQREQNLQLHRRGHNLPWTLKQKSTKEVKKKKVYLCPEPTCVHHHPSRALGDLTGIKKHFFRKHGEKKWKCQKCSKTYAVQSDFKAHSKTCGTKEYRCDCGTLFSRRDSFVTHQAFCDALARDYALNHVSLNAIKGNVPNFHESNLLAGHNGDGFRPCGNSLLHPFNGASAFHPTSTAVFTSPNCHEEDQELLHSPNKLVFNGMLQQNPRDRIQSELSCHELSNACGDMGGSGNSAGGSSAGLFSSDHNFMGDHMNPLYTIQSRNPNSSSGAHLSATALLQKAAQVGSSCSINGSSSLLRSLGSSLSSSNHDLHASVGATSFGAILGDQNNHNHLHELMSSLGGGGSTTSSVFGSLAKRISGYNENGQEIHNLSTSEYATNDETKLKFGKFIVEDEYSHVSVAECDRLTRDFMGVGQLIRHASSGLSQTDPPQRHQMI